MSKPSTEVLEIPVKGKQFTGTLQVRRVGGRYEVLNSAVADRPELTLVFKPTGAGVENLDESSDIAQCFNKSTKIRFNGIVQTLTELRASSPEELESLVRALPWTTCCLEEI